MRIRFPLDWSSLHDMYRYAIAYILKLPNNVLPKKVVKRDLEEKLLSVKLVNKGHASFRNVIFLPKK